MVKHLITRYIDGSGHLFEVSAHLYDDGIEITSCDPMEPLALYWDLNKIDLIEPTTRNTPGIISFNETPFVQLMIEDQTFFEALTQMKPNLKTHNAQKPFSSRTICVGFFVVILLTLFATSVFWKIEPKNVIDSLKSGAFFVPPSHE